jgi:methylenetetrahydrofolate dehydrogenase (NADP+)/methenyltetrahydrofolate cyclohydrolase
MANATGELNSKHIVEQLDEGLRERVDYFTSVNPGITPKLAILYDNPDYGPSQKYVGIKQKVGARLGIAVEPMISSDVVKLMDDIDRCNEATDIHGIIVQLPLAHPSYTDQVTERISKAKDVDGLTLDSPFSPATPLGIMNLLDGYGIDYKNEDVIILGQGRLVGAPLLRLMQKSGAMRVKAFDENSPRLDLLESINSSHVLVSAMGMPGALNPELFANLHTPHVVVDAGAAEQDGLVVGDVDDDLRAVGLENGWLITPAIGGIGPLTVRALLSNVMLAAENQLRAS